MKQLNKPLNKDEFKCAKCSEVFKKGWTDEEAEKEAEQWGDCGEMSTLCDDCYTEFISLHSKVTNSDKL